MKSNKFGNRIDPLMERMRFWEEREEDWNSFENNTKNFDLKKTFPYTVEEGDTLDSIASKFNTTVDILLALNSELKKGENPVVGTVIQVPLVKSDHVRNQDKNNPFDFRRSIEDKDKEEKSKREHPFKRKTTEEKEKAKRARENKKAVKAFIKEGRQTLKRIKKAGAEEEDLDSLVALTDLYKAALKNKADDFDWGAENAVNEFKRSVLTTEVQDSIIKDFFYLSKAFPEEERMLERMTNWLDWNQVNFIPLKPILKIPVNYTIPEIKPIEIKPTNYIPYGSDVNWKIPLTAAQKERYQWDLCLEQFKAAHKPYPYVESKHLAQWVRKQISLDWRPGEEVPLITTVDTYWGKGIYYRQEVDVLYIVAYSKRDMDRFLTPQMKLGFWQRVGPLSEEPVGEMQQKDSLEKFNQMNYPAVEATIDEVYMAIGNEDLRDKAKAEGKLGRYFIMMVKEAQDKFFEKRPTHYGMYTEDTRKKVTDYNKSQQAKEDLELASFDEYNLPDYLKSSEHQFEAAVVLSLKETGNLYKTYREYKRLSQSWVLYNMMRFKVDKNFINWTYGNWASFTRDGKVPDKPGLNPYDANNPFANPGLSDSDNVTYCEARWGDWSGGVNLLKSPGNRVMLDTSFQGMFDGGAYYLNMMAMLFHLENSEFSNGKFATVDDITNAFRKYEVMVGEYHPMKNKEDDGEFTSSANMIKDKNKYSFKGFYSNYLYDRTNQMLRTGKKNLKDEMNRYGTVSDGKVTLGKDINSLVDALIKIQPYFTEADQVLNDVIVKHHRTPNFEDWEPAAKESTKLMKLALKEFNKLRETYPILLSKEFVVNPDKDFYEGDRLEGIFSLYPGYPCNVICPKIGDIKALVNRAGTSKKAKENVVTFLDELYQDRLENIKELENDLKEHPEWVWKLENAVEATKAELNFTPGTLYAEMVDNFRADELEEMTSMWSTIAQIGLGIVTFFFPVLAPITIPIGLALGTADLIKSIDEYNFTKRAGNISYDPKKNLTNEKATIIWILIDAVGLVLDVVDIVKFAKFAKVGKTAKQPMELFSEEILAAADDTVLKGESKFFSVDDQSIADYKAALEKRLKDSITNSTKRQELIDELADPQRLKKLNKEEAARDEVIAQKGSKPVWKDPKAVPKKIQDLFNYPTLGRYYTAGAHRLSAIPTKDGNLLETALKIAKGQSDLTEDIMESLLRIAGESDELAQSLGVLYRATTKQGEDMFTRVLKYELSRGFQKQDILVRNIQASGMTDADVEKVMEDAIKKTNIGDDVPKAFHEDLIEAAANKRTIIRDKAYTDVKKTTNRQKQNIINDQIEDNKKAVELGDYRPFDITKFDQGTPIITRNNKHYTHNGNTDYYKWNEDISEWQDIGFDNYNRGINEPEIHVDIPEIKPFDIRKFDPGTPITLKNGKRYTTDGGQHYVWDETNNEWSKMTDTEYNIAMKEKDVIFDPQKNKEKIDDLFKDIKDNPDFQGFGNLCKNNPNITVETAGKEWDDFVATTRKNYGIAEDRNIATINFNGQEYIIASGKKYSNQMANSNEFIPRDFVLQIKSGEGIFSPTMKTRDLDTELIGLEFFAKEKKAIKNNVYPQFTDEIIIKTDLCPCPSCSAVFQQFSTMFPNVKIKIITTTKLHY